jgi:hypothetical protein
LYPGAETSLPWTERSSESYWMVIENYWEKPEEELLQVLTTH